ncbi:MAG: hypothetical protein ABSF26_30195 [Thermoguttaceae bacterium]|jgi:hypothetical protein
MTRKVPLTLDDHRLIAAILHAVHTETVRLHVDLANLLGKSHRASVRAGCAADTLSATRSELEDLLYRDIRSAFDTRIYYPGPVPERAELTDLGEISKQLSECEHGVQDVLGRLWRALPVKSLAVRSLEKARDALAGARVPLFGK